MSRFAWSTLATISLVVAPSAFAQRPESKRPESKRPKVQPPSRPSRRADSGSSDSAAAKQAVDFTNVLQAESSILVATIEGSEKLSKPGAATPTPTQVAANIVANASRRYVPPSCVAATRSGLTVTLVFSDCTGPRGLRQITGVLNEVVSMGAAGTVDIHATATQLQIGLTTVSMNSNSVYAVSGTTRSMAVTRTGTGIGPLGNNIVQNSNYTTTWDANCVKIDGSWQVTSGMASRSKISSVTRCGGHCPTGTVTQARGGLGGRTITITFDGTPQAKWTTFGGKSGLIDLTCVP